MLMRPVFFFASALALASCDKTPSEPAPAATAATVVDAVDPFEVKLAGINDPDELLKLVDTSGGLPATLKNRKISARMAVLMEDKFESAPNPYELYKQYEKYALQGPAKMSFKKAEQQLDASK